MLLPELEYEALQFAARDTLDVYQLLSRKKNKLVKKYSDVLALRYVSRVVVSECHRVLKHQYSVTLGDDTEWKADPALEKDQFYLHVLRRLRNAFVSVLQVRCTDCSNFLLFAKNHAASLPMFALEEILVGSHELVCLPSDLLSFVYGKLGATALRMIREAELEPYLDEKYLPLVQHPLAKLRYFHLWCVHLSKASLDFLFNGCSLRGFLAMIGL
ncbi:hypothetical protein AAVH_28231 [Aphelenchoides avenae]|nr:hypothetical protein AAVH_28759 [Aphelenchus avenae]KAH7704582.1 hypothetical protein AAVH_28231 [Aphelenchus avenae]